MNRSYVGVVTPRGLQAIYRESDDLVESLNRKRLDNSQGLCWAVLPDEAVFQVTRELFAGENELAWKTLQTESVHCGSI